MNITTLGSDLTKTSFSPVGMDQRGKVVLLKTLKRAQLLSFIAQCPVSLIGMEACNGAHYWGREFTKPGHWSTSSPASLSPPFAKAAE